MKDHNGAKLLVMDAKLRVTVALPDIVKGMQKQGLFGRDGQPEEPVVSRRISALRDENRVWENVLNTAMDQSYLR